MSAAPHQPPEVVGVHHPALTVRASTQPAAAAAAAAGSARPRDLLMLTTCTLDSETLRLMAEEEGWRIITVLPISNPFAGPNDYKASKVFSKLRIWVRYVMK